MPPDSPILLVIDPNPESAARVNGLLRNSGISIHVLHVDNPTEAERLVREFSPFLIYYLPASQGHFPISEAARLARDKQVFLGVALPDGGQALFEEAAASTATLGVGDEAQLPAIARRLSGLGLAAKAQDLIRAQGEELEQRLDLLLNSTRDPIAYFHEGLHVAANQAYLELMHAESMEAMTVVSMLEILEREETDLKAMVRAFSRGEMPEDGMRFALRPQGGEAMDVDLFFAPVRYEGEDCVQMLVRPLEAAQPAIEAAPATAVAMDPAPAEKSVETPVPAPTPELPAAPPPAPEAAAADLDPMTGMYWRAPFMRRLNGRLAQLPNDRRAAVLFLAMDQTQNEWDDLSAADLDAYVQATASEVLSSLEDDDDVCRFSDTHYALFVLRNDKSAIRRLGEKLRAGIERLAEQAPDAPLPKSCSVGYVLLDNQHHDPEHTLEKARAACRLAAEEGNTVVRYKPARVAGISEDEEAEWRERLRYGLENEDFYTVQHSIMNLDGDLEGLMENRTFLHEDEADLDAAAYLPAAERNQLASQVDRLVIPSLLRAVAGSDDRQIVDISGNSLQDFSFPAWFQRTLQETRVPGKRIVLQWPSWAARQQTRAARRLIEELSPLGVQFSVSGFDADPKTLELLQELKLQFVTLEQDLTRNLHEDPDRLDMIREIVRASESMQVLSIASDVPTSSDLAMLWRGGVKLVSGEFIQETPRVIGQ